MEITKVDSFWDEQTHSGHRHSAPAVQPRISVGNGGPASAHSPYERNLNFATVAVEDGEYGFPKKKTVRDPLSHRIIEKRRRDRMNNCLADLSRLLPPSSLRKGRGRIEKTEIVELAIKHLRHLQCHPCPMGDKCEFSVVTESSSTTNVGSPTASFSSSSTPSGYHSSNEEQFRLGFQECISETMHFLVEQEGLFAGDTMCARLVQHLNSYCDTVLRDHWGNQGKIVPGFRRVNESAADFKKTGCSGGSSSSGYHPNGSSSGSDGNGGNDGDGTEPFALPVQNPPQHLNVENSRHSLSVLDYDPENSCSSTPLSVETSDVLSLDGKNNNRLSSKPPIPSIICSHSSNNSGSPANGSTNGRSSDDGSANSSTSSAHRYKFKSNIKQRFTADCQTKPDDGTYYSQGNREKHSGRDGADCDRDVSVMDDGVSDGEEVADERISIMEDTILSSRQSVGDESERKNMKQMSGSRGGPPGGHSNHSQSVSVTSKPTQQISTIGAASSSSSSPLDKTAFSSSSASSNSAVGAKSSSALSASLYNHLEGQTARGRDVEMKPSPEELLSAIHNLSGGGASGKAQLPIIIGGEKISCTGEKGVPAFALHDKGLFYIPLTLDKSAVAPFIGKFDSTESPPLYPVTISVCFLQNSDKKGKVENVHESRSRVDTPVSDVPTEFSKSVVSPTPIPLISGRGHASGPPVKSNRRGYREGNPFVGSRFYQQILTSKESNPLARLSGTGGAAYPTSYQDGRSSGSPVTVAVDIGGGGGGGGTESESHSSSGCGRSNGGGGESSSEHSSITGSVSRSRKRSISSSPSVTGSGGSLGYHSWNEKNSSNSHDFFNFHSNTHNLAAMAAHSHGHLTPVATPVGGGAISPISGQRHGPPMHNYPDYVSKEKDLSFTHDKRTKKARSVDQILDTK